MSERIYATGEGGELVVLEEQRFASERELQELVAGQLQLLDGEQMRPGDPLRWILIEEEKGVSEDADSAARWAVDLVLADQDALVTLVEVKRSTNREVRRSVVGQLLEYAAHAAHTWSADDLRVAHETTATLRGCDPATQLQELLPTQEQLDADAFWDKAATGLAAGRMRLLFVSDEIPDSLRRIVEFLNEHMPTIEVLAVEIKPFGHGQAETFVPRVFGKTAKPAPGARRTLSRESFLAEFDSAETRDAAAQLLQVAETSGALLSWGPQSVTVRVDCDGWDQPVTVAWLNTPSMDGWGWMRTRYFTFGESITSYDDPAPSEPLSETLKKWERSFRDDSFAQDASSKGVKAWSITYDDAAHHIDKLATRLAAVVTELQSL